MMADTKPSSQLLSEIKASDSKTLKDVTTVENPAAKHDMAMVRIIIVKKCRTFFSRFGLDTFERNLTNPNNEFRI